MKFILFCFSIFFFFSASGQVNFLTKKGSTYYYDGKVYKYQDLGPIYQQDEEAHNVYLSGFKWREKARKNGNIATALFFGGVTLISVGSETYNSNSIASIATYMILGSYTLGVVYFVQRIIGVKKLNKAKNLFNFNMIERHGYQSEPSLSLAITGNGLGFVYTF